MDKMQSFSATAPLMGFPLKQNALSKSSQAPAIPETQKRLCRYLFRFETFLSGVYRWRIPCMISPIRGSLSSSFGFGAKLPRILLRRVCCACPVLGEFGAAKDYVAQILSISSRHNPLAHLHHHLLPDNLKTNVRAFRNQLVLKI